MNTSEAMDKKNEIIGISLCDKLNSQGYKAQYVNDKESALQEALKLIPNTATVGIPGSVTIREIGLLESLEKRGTKIAHHWRPNLSKEEHRALIIEEFLSDWIVTSVNAIAFDKGTLISIDGVGNRVGAMSWAPGKLLVIAGVNKIAMTVHEAMGRARNVATPANMIRLNLSTPCADTGYCTDCDVPDRACNIVTMLERAPTGRECHVFIVGERLGY